MMTSPLGSFRAAIAPFLSEAWFTAWTISCGDLRANAGSVDPLTSISLASLPDINFFGGSPSPASTVAQDRAAAAAGVGVSFFCSCTSFQTSACPPRGSKDEQPRPRPFSYCGKYPADDERCGSSSTHAHRKAESSRHRRRENATEERLCIRAQSPLDSDSVRWGCGQSQQTRVYMYLA